MNMNYTFEEDLMFDDISFYSLEISDEKAKKFFEMIMADDMPNEYQIDLVEFSFKVNKSKMEFRILKRHYRNENHPFYKLQPSKQQVDFAVYMAYRTSMKAGFTSFLENKFNN